MSSNARGGFIAISRETLTNIHQNMTQAIVGGWALNTFTSWPQLAQGAWGGL